MKQLYAGAAKTCITPPPDMMPAESFLPIKLTKVYRDLFVRALVLDHDDGRFALIVFDSGDMSRGDEMREILLEQFDIQPQNVLFTVTHTHEAPSFANDHVSIRENPEKLAWVTKYGNFVIGKMTECVQQAVNLLEPVRWGFAKGSSYINTNRDLLYEDGTWDIGMNYAGPSDKELDVISFVDMQGKEVAVVTNYAVHGTVCFFGKDEAQKEFMISGDLPGMTTSYLEERYADKQTVFLWTSGAAGNQAPLYMPQMERIYHDGSHDLSYDLGYACWTVCEHLAELHSMDIIRTLDSVDHLADMLRFAVVDQTVEVPRLMNEESENEEFVKLVLKLVMLNDVAIVGIGAEIVMEIGERIKALIPYKNTIIIEHIAERIDYIPDKLGFERKTFEGTNTRIKDGLGEEYILCALQNMLQQLYQ